MIKSRIIREGNNVKLFYSYFALFVFALLTCASSVMGQSWMVSTDWSNNQHIRTATITYSASDLAALPFVGRNYDLVINPNAMMANSLRKYNPDIKLLKYVTLSSIRSEDLSAIPSFASQRGYGDSLFYHWVSGDSVVVYGSGGLCNETITRSYRGQRIQFCGWTENRYLANFTNEETQAYFRWKAFNSMGSTYDGVAEDEAHYYTGANHMMFPFRATGSDELKWIEGTTVSDVQDWEGYTYEQARDSLKKLRVNPAKGTGWLKAFCDTLYAEEKMHLANVTNYGIIHPSTDPWLGTKEFGMGATLFETCSSPVYLSMWGSYIWTYMDSIISWDTGYAVVFLTVYDDEATILGTLDRCQMERLTFYYMAAVPERFFFMLVGNSATHPPGDYKVADTTFKWFNAINHDVGYPTAQRYVIASGTDGAGQAYNLYRRDYTNALMLYRMKGGSNYGDASGVSYNLGSNFQELYADGTLGPIVTSALIRNTEGKIFIPEGSSIIDTIPPDSIDDLGQNNPDPEIPESQSMVSTEPHFYPNPFDMTFTPTTTFTGVSDEATLVLMTPTGDIIRSWDHLSGEEIIWDGTNANGSEVASSVYLWYLADTDYKGKLVVIN